MRVHAIAVLSAFLCVAAATPASAAAPAAPDTLRKQRLGDDLVRITWNDNSNNENGFEILRRGAFDSESQFEFRGTVGPDVTEFVDLAPRGTIFVYRVRAFNQDGDSDLSNECYVNRNPMALPLYFNVRLIALTVIRVGWHDRSNGERGFEIQRADFGKGFKTIAHVAANTELYDDYSLEPAHSYTYRIRALGKTGICVDNSRFTPERSATTHGSVRILQIELRGLGNGTVTSKPSGISCGPKDDHCAAEFPLATDVTLTATPGQNSFFARWVDLTKCEGSKLPCTVHMGEDRVIGATFKKKP